MSITKTVRFDLKRMNSSLIVLSIFPVSLLLIFVLYFYLLFSGASLTVSNYVELSYLLARMYAYILQFILSIYSILIGIYLFDDQALPIIITSFNHRQKPFLVKILSSLILLTILNLVYLTIFTIFSFFLIATPNMNLIFVLFCVGIVDMLVFSSITFFGYALIKWTGISSVLASLVPLSLFFVLPQFLYSGISVGIIPPLFYSFTLQYHLSAFANYFIPSPLIVPIASSTISTSIIIIIFCILCSYVCGLFFTKYMEYH